MIYFVIFAVLLVLSVLEVYGKLGKAREPLFWLTALGLALFTGFKWETGTDWAAYRGYFRASIQNRANRYADYEVGFELWNRIVSTFTQSYTLYMTLTGAITIVIIFLAFRLSSPLWFPAALVSFANTLVSFSLTRQTIAAAFVLFAFVVLIKEKRLLFVTLVLLATTFHVSAVMVLVALFVNKEQPGKIVVSIVGMSLLIGMTGLLSGALAWVGSWFPIEAIAVQLQHYAQADNSFGLNIPGLRSLFGPAKHLSLFLLFYWFRFYSGDTEKSTWYVFHLYLVGLVIYLLTFRELMVFQRFFWYFNPVQAILVGKILWTLKDRALAIVGTGLSFYYGILLWFTLRSYWSEYVPYTTFFSST